MHIIWSVIIGLIVGLIARALVPGRNPLGIIRTAILGIIGAVAAKYLGHAIGWYGPGDKAGFIASVIGAVILLYIYEGLIRKHAARAAGPPDTR